MNASLPPILFQDADALVIDKRAGLDVTRPRRGGPSVEAMLPALALGFRRAPSIVHRLDCDTSGCLLLARTDRAHRRFQQAFEAGLVEKAYVAILDGEPEGDDGLIDLPLAKVSSAAAGWRMVADAKGKAAQTHWHVLARHEGRALIRFKPETGRTHQLRVHAASGLGAPILGDPVYGQPRADGLMLHAISLSVPRDGRGPVVAHAPWPDRFAALGFHP